MDPKLFRLMMGLFRADAPSDGGGGPVTLESIQKAVVDMGTKVATKAEVAAVVEDLKTFKTDVEKDVLKVAAQAAQVRKDLAMSLGASGADDFLNEMGKYLRGVYQATKGQKISDTDEIAGAKVADLVAKAQADFGTVDSGNITSGLLLPTQLMPQIRELLDIYGNFYPRVTSVKMPAGHSLSMNRDSARPSAFWRAIQVATVTEENTPMTWAQDTLVSILCGSYVQISNELLRSPHVNFAAVCTVRMLHAILRKLEFGLIAGTTAGGEPSDGLIASATDQGTMATMTFANLVQFLKDCITDNEYAYNPQRNAVIITPTDAMTLATQAVGATELTGMLVWGNPRTGVPTTVMGYELIVHPAAYNGTSKHVLLGDPSTITLVEDSAPSVDLSSQAGNAFMENASILRVINHYDWNIGQPSEWHKKVVTA